MDFLQKLKVIEKIDTMIQNRSTGNPFILAIKLDVSERTVYNIIATMKKIGAPIYFCKRQGSFCYRDEVSFKFGFDKRPKMERVDPLRYISPNLKLSS